MAGGGTAERSTLKIFISYSRKDQAFAEDLVCALKAAGFDTFIDKQDIAAGEDWEARLGRMIEVADTIVFLISPDSISSSRCSWEIDCALTLKKRLFPVVWRSVDESAVPPRLKQLNYIFFDRPQYFGASLLALATALRTDTAWVREHTRLGEAASRWDMRGRPEVMLLRGEELAAAFEWLQAQPEYAPQPTLLHIAYITSGQEAEAARANAERQRLEQMAVAQAERQTALDREQVALQQTEAALRQAQAALRNRQRAQITVVGLLCCLVVGLVGWINQAWLIEQFNWYTKMRPYMNANFRPHVLSGADARALGPGAVFRECARDCPDMVVVPAGSFVMGAASTLPERADEGPPHDVTFSRPFAVSKFPVTFSDWTACAQVGGCPDVPDSGFGGGARPVINVSWDDAQRYAAWLSLMTGRTYRLPSEAEWEYAARAGTTTAYWWGDEPGLGNSNCIGCGSQWDNRQTSPVGSFKPNAFGLYDVHGNVWQWVQDCYHDSYDGAPPDGSPRLEGCAQGRRAVRGGGWDSLAINLRVTNRDRISIGNRLNDLGFRLVRDLPP